MYDLINGVFYMGYEPIWKDQENLNENEINKLKKDGLEVFRELETLCSQPFDTIPKSYYMYLKYAGLTVQKPQEAGLFMFRVKIPAGKLTAQQAEYLAWLGDTYGKGILDLTTRQSVQCHWVPFHALPSIFAKLREAGLTTSEAEGDTPRNIISSPTMDLSTDDLFEVEALIREVDQYLQDNRDFSNLPRKFKISISSNIWNSGNAQIQDLAFTPASKTIDGTRVLGFHVYVGGGLGAMPALAQQLNLFVQPSEVLRVVIGVLTLYRDYGYRVSRKKARLKFLLKDWGAARFEEMLLSLTGPLETAGLDEMKGWKFGIAPALAPQRQQGYYTAGIRVLTGRMPASDLRDFAALSREFGRGELRIDHCQNLIIPFIPETKLTQFQAHPLVQRYGILGTGFADHGMCCTGNEFCNMAIANTKDMTRALLEHLDQHISLDVPVRITVNGCPNNCGHRSIADIALLGIRIPNPDNEPEEGYMLSIGGSLEGVGDYTHALKGRVRKSYVNAFMTDFLLALAAEKKPMESFYYFYQRVGLDLFQHKMDEISKQYEPVV